MATPESRVAMAAQEAASQAFKAWQAEKNDSKRTALMHRYQQLDGTARNLWAAIGPDPLLRDVGTALARAAARDTDPNPDDPDDEGEAR